MTWTLPRAIAAQCALTALLLGGLGLAGWPPSALMQTDWWLPFLVSQVGLFLGSLGILWLSDHPAQPGLVVQEGRLADLRQNHELVIAQLRQLESERPKMREADYERERDNLLSIGAAALRELEESEQAKALAHPEPEGADLVVAQLETLRAQNPKDFEAALAKLNLRPVAGGIPESWKGAFSVLAMLALGVALWQGAGGTARDRMSGAPITGGDSVRGSAPTDAPQEDSVLAQIKAHLKTNPDDLDALNQGTERALAQQDMASAMSFNLHALEVAPDDVDAQTYRAVMTAFIGQADEALASLDALIAKHPGSQRPLIYRGLLSLSSDLPKAIEVLERALEIHDDPSVRNVLNEAKARAGLAGSTPPPSAATTPTERLQSYVRGSIHYEGPVAPGATLFISLRDPAGGPPLAALKSAATRLPLDFELTQAQRLMMGGNRPMPEHVTLTVRLDSDGDPVTRPDTDPHAEIEGIALGSSDITVTLATSAP